MGKVLQFTLPKPRLWVRGWAHCLACGERWYALSEEADRQRLACPRCHGSSGVLDGVVAPTDPARWVCGCGSDVFHLLPHASECVWCGQLQTRG